MANYNDKLDADAQITMEEGIAATIFVRLQGRVVTEDNAAALGRQILKSVLENFRPDLIDKPKPESQNFLVISYDDDEEQQLLDFVAAPDEDKALELAGGVRGDYAFVVSAWTAKELREFARQLDVSESLPTTPRELAAKVGELHQFQFEEENEDDGESGGAEA